MPRLHLYAAGIGLALIVGSLALMSGMGSCARHKGEAGEAQAQQHVQEAEHHAGAAEAKDAQIAALQGQIQESEARVAVLKAKLAKIPHPPVASGIPVVAPGVGEPNGDLVESLRAENAVQAELIQAQDTELSTVKKTLTVALESRDEWKAAYESERKARLAQEAATEAWKKAVKTSRWQGRIEGFAVGLALGYVGGRR